MRRRVAKTEASIIHSSIARGTRRAVIVYDNLASPPTYGDYLYVVLLARYLIARGIHVSFYIVDSGVRRKDWTVFTEACREEFVNEQMKVAEVFLDANLATIQRISWHDCQARILNRLYDSVFPFYERVHNRLAMFNQCFNLLNHLLSNADQNVRDRVLFSYQDLTHKIEFRTVKGPYISWHCRYSEKWDPERNTNENDFLKIYAYLHSRFPDHSIMIVSDAVGCLHYAKLARRHTLPCLFSKDYSQTFLGDAALILGSTFFFVIRGGGISIIPMFSKVPYEIYTPIVSTETAWSKEKIGSWQSEQQVWMMDQPRLLFEKTASHG